MALIFITHMFLKHTVHRFYKSMVNTQEQNMEKRHDYPKPKKQVTKIQLEP